MSQEIATITNTNELIFNPTAMDQMYRLAEIMASSRSTVPAHLKGSVGDCMAIIIQSAQFKMNPFAVAQKTFLVNGVLGYEAQLVNAIITNNGPVKGRFDYEFFGDWKRVQGKTKEVESKQKSDESGRPKKYRVPDWTFADEKGLGVIVRNTIVGEDKPRELTLMMSQALTRNSSQWADDPQQQLSYLAVKKWARRYCPDVILGVYSYDEVDDAPAEKVINPMPHENTELNKVLEKVKTMQVADFAGIDTKAFSQEDLKVIRQACAARKKEILDSAVVATVEKEPEAKKEPEKAPDTTDWANLVENAQTVDELNAILKSMTPVEQDEWYDTIDFKKAEMEGM